ncbi:hypothetical protein KSD_38030 [Ktedonobacter sp. SOSP1-85]|nr:hypothetical protein KSD_38030 [Ktedonobacter sp. SOSP1-85]
MHIEALHDKEKIEKYLLKNVGLYLYHLGDLDDFFWPYTCWYALMDGQEIHQLALLYIGGQTPVLLALTDHDEEGMRLFMRLLLPLLPSQLDAHLSPWILDIIEEAYTLRSYGTHMKMLLQDSRRLQTINTSQTIALGPRDLPEIEEFYRVSYPNNFFDPRMLETGCFCGIRAATVGERAGALQSIAGIHVYSEPYKAAALGSVATHPQWRGRGLGTEVCARLSQELLTRVEHIGLNVKTDNIAALRCYERLGYRTIATYEEASLTRKV